jgi:tetratricopeptide (TPR) repeat protein
MSGALRKDLIGELKRIRGLEIVKIEDQELPRNVSFDYVLRLNLETNGERGRLQIGLERWTDRIGGKRALKPIEVAQDSLEDSDKNDFALQDKLVRAAVRTLKKRLSELTIRPATTTTRDVEKSLTLTRHAHEVLHRGTTKHLLSSISSFRSAIEADPNSALPHAGMAEALVRKYLYFDGDMSYIEEARVEAAHALARDPNCAEAHTSLGFAFHLLGRGTDAQREYRLAIQLDHDEWLAHRLLGALYARAGNFKEASPLLRRAIALHPTQIASYDHLYGVLQRLDRYEESLQIADKGIGAAQSHLAKFPDSQEARLHLAMLFARLGQGDDAREQVRKALEYAPKDCYTAFHAAIVLAILLDVPEAMESLSQAAARGYNIHSEAQRNSDLDPLRGLPEFQALMR